MRALYSLASTLSTATRLVLAPLALAALFGCSSRSDSGSVAGAGTAAVAGGNSGGAGASPGGAPFNTGGSSGAHNDSGAAGGSAAGSSGVSAGGASGSSGVVNGGAANGGAANGGGAPNAVTASELARAMGFGTNIGNTFDNTTTWETGWGEPLVTQAFINGVAAHGFKTMRVPVAWNTYATNGVIDATKLARVKEVVGWIRAAGMYSIVNIHWDGGWIDNENTANQYRLTDDVKSKFASYWTQIATAFADVGPQLIFEGLNEEGKFYTDGDTSKAPDYAALNQLNQLFVSTVRAQAGYNTSRALLIAGFQTDIDLTCVDAFSVPSDPAGTDKLLLSIHYYTPYTFTGLDTVESWGSPATTWGTAADQSALDALFTKLATFGAQKSIPVVLGEFAVTRGQSYVREPASRTAWMEAVAKASLMRGIVPVLWDTGSDVSRSDGSLSTELQATLNAVE